MVSQASKASAASAASEDNDDSDERRLKDSVGVSRASTNTAIVPILTSNPHLFPTARVDMPIRPRPRPRPRSDSLRATRLQTRLDSIQRRRVRRVHIVIIVIIVHARRTRRPRGSTGMAAPALVVVIIIIKRDIVLLDVNDGLAQQRVGLSNNDGRDLER